MSKFWHARWHGCWPWCTCTSWRIWRWISGRLPEWASSGNLLQVWWSQSLCSRLSSASYEVLCLWEASKLKLLGNILSRETTNRVRAIFLVTALHLMVVLSTLPGKYATNVVRLGLSLATVPPPKSTGRQDPTKLSNLSHRSRHRALQQLSHSCSGRSSV